jgi:DUF438 domain-containing protein
MKQEELQDELNELSLHLADMLEVALIYAGAKKQKIEKVANLYIESIDEALKDDDSAEGELDSEEDFLSIDEDELKEVVDDSIKNSDEFDQQPSNSEDIKSSVKEQFNQLITTDLIKEALKDMKITITFSDKD